MLSGRANARVLMPNPFYQIYEGAALLRGATPCYVPATGSPDFDSVPAEIWPHVELVYLCNPGNPSGEVVPECVLADLLRRAHEHDFVIAADECYSEIYRDEADPPIGLLQAAANANLGHARCVVFNSLSKRSNLPGLRSGFAAGDARLIDRYYHYRTYHGCAMPAHVATASALAWNDEQHVVANRAVYRAKFDAVHPILAHSLDVDMPAAAFYLWPRTPVDGEVFAARLYEAEHIVVLPGAYLGRAQDGVNPARRECASLWWRRSKNALQPPTAWRLSRPLWRGNEHTPGRVRGIRGRSARPRRSADRAAFSVAARPRLPRAAAGTAGQMRLQGRADAVRRRRQLLGHARRRQQRWQP